MTSTAWSRCTRRRTRPPAGSWKSSGWPSTVTRSTPRASRFASTRSSAPSGSASLHALERQRPLDGRLLGDVAQAVAGRLLPVPGVPEVEGQRLRLPEQVAVLDFAVERAGLAAPAVGVADFLGREDRAAVEARRLIVGCVEDLDRELAPIERRHHQVLRQPLAAIVLARWVDHELAA